MYARAMADKVLATITSYNPDIELLEKNIDAVIPQADKVIVYENNSNNREAVIALCEKKDVTLVLNDKNYGVAGPLHDGAEYACENGYKYILTLDQDSVCSDGMVAALTELFETDEALVTVAASPVMTVNGETVDNVEQNKYVKDVITSGSLSDAQKIKEIGGYMPEMFIDWVDTEICFRAGNSGYKILASTVPFIHTFGEPERRRILWKRCIVTNYSPFRCYYISRNSAFCAKVYGGELAKRRKRYLRKLKIKIILYEKNKREKLKALKKGKKDAKAFYKQMIDKYRFLTEIRR